MRHAKKPIALLLVLLMFVSLLPVGAVAADAEPAEDTEAVETQLPAAPAEEAPADDPAAPADGADPAPAEDGGEVPPPAGDPADAPADDPDPADAPTPAEPAPDADADADADDAAELETQADEPIEDWDTGLIYTVKNNKATVVDRSSRLSAELSLYEVGGVPIVAIADHALEYSNVLESVTLPDGIAIGASAFEGCSLLTTVTFGETVGSIGEAAFAGCEALQSVELPPMETLSPALFAGCSSLSSATLPSNLRTIGEEAFCECKALQSIAFPATLTAIGEAAFLGSGLTAVDIPDSVTALGDAVFSECRALADVRLPSGLKTIGEDMFYFTAIQSIEIPDSVTSIGAAAFEDCAALTEITIPDSVKSIGMYAFSWCEGLQNITLPAGLKTIEEGLFYYCEALESITLPDGVTAIGGSAFRSCYALESITLPAGVTAIGEEAFRESGLTAIVIPAGVTAIADMTFYKCDALESITLPDGVTAIGSNAFGYCDALESITLPAGLTAIGDEAFSFCSGLTNIRIPNGVTTIGINAFRDCESLKTVRLPEGLGKIQMFSFAQCFALESIVIPDGVTAIEEDAFMLCDHLRTITIPASVTSIERDAFEGCRALTTVYYVGTQEQEEALKRNVADGNDRLFTSEWVLVAECGDVPAITFERNYIIMRDDDDRLTFLTATVPGGIPASAEVSWSVDNESVIPTLIPSPVDTENGVVQALIIPGGETGTAWVTVTLTTTAGSSSARCRIDKTEGAVLPTLEDVTLVESKAAVEVFRTDYTRITVVPNLKQNAFGTTSSLIDGVPAPEPEFEEVFAIRKAEFDDPTGTGINDYFRLHVVDDRTLEIIPTRKALEDAEAKDPALKGTYKNAVKVWVDGEGDENAFTTGLLTLTVKKSLPKLKAAPVKLNSFILDEQEVSFTGGTVTKITAVEGTVPDWLIMPAVNTEPADLVFGYDGPIHTDAPKSQKASLKLTVEAEGWAIRQTVPVTVTAAPILPKVKFSKSSIMLNPLADAQGTAAVTCMTVTPALYADRDLFTVRVLEGKVERTATGVYEANSPHDFIWNVQAADDGSGKLFFMITPGSTFGSAENARTFKVMVGVGGKEFPLTLKTPAASKAGLSVSVKSSGVIDFAVPESPVTLDVTVKNTSYIDPAFYQRYGGHPFGTIDITFVKKTYGGDTEDVAHLSTDDLPYFEYFKAVNSGLTRITLTADMLDSLGVYLNTEDTFTADVTVSYGEDPAMNRTVTGVKIPVKLSDPEKMKPKVTAKAKGKLDVLRPDSEILLTPTFKNMYSVDLSDTDLVELTFLRKIAGGYETAPAGLFTAEVDESGTAYRIRMNVGYGVDYKKDKFFVGVSVPDPWGYNRIGMPKPVALPLTMGSAKVTQSTKTVTLLKRDKNSSAEFTLGTTDPALKIASVKITNDKAGLYQLTEIGSGQYALSYSGRMLTAPTKGTTLKLAVTLVGNNSGKPNATISLAVKFA